MFTMDLGTDTISELASHYVQHGVYLDGLTKEKKRAVRKRAMNLTVQRGVGILYCFRCCVLCIVVGVF